MYRKALRATAILIGTVGVAWFAVSSVHRRLGAENASQSIFAYSDNFLVPTVLPSAFISAFPSAARKTQRANAKRKIEAKGRAYKKRPHE